MKNVPPSNESNLSPYYMEASDDPEKPAELKKDNGFLHSKDQVD